MFLGDWQPRKVSTYVCEDNEMIDWKKNKLHPPHLENIDIFVSLPIIYNEPNGIFRNFIFFALTPASGYHTSSEIPTTFTLTSGILHWYLRRRFLVKKVELKWSYKTDVYLNKLTLLNHLKREETATFTKYIFLPCF